MSDLAAALLERRFPLADAAAALFVPAAVLQPGADEAGSIRFRRAVRLALAHHRTLAYAVRGPAPAPGDRETYQRHLPAARQAVGTAISEALATAAERVAGLPAAHPWDKQARDRVATALRTASTRRYGRRANG
ncbi:hypothetical protein [Cereibacter johrii]|uniref:hypothetical protein n=1 Tax=Cereibacter johrii TaxID=445629 RepID=UPI000DCB9980|nr:hypothetical protein [Cereibacter johrii]RAZ83302.1 hypothetical protein DDV93_13350 [Cereibacter johrii]